MTDVLLEVLKLRKEIAELKVIVTEIAGSKSVLPSQDKAISLEEKITAFLHEIKIPAKLLGYSYLREAIKEVYEDPDLIGAFTTALYPNIAKKLESTPSRVERAIRHAIETAWKKNMQHSFYSMNFNSKPTNSDFIALIADELLLVDKYEKSVQV